MSKIKIFTAQNEFEAMLLKGYLENNGIKASVAPGVSSLTFKQGSRGPNVGYDIFVNEDKAEKAIKLLKENGNL